MRKPAGQDKRNDTAAGAQIRYPVTGADSVKPARSTASREKRYPEFFLPNPKTPALSKRLQSFISRDRRLAGSDIMLNLLVPAACVNSNF